MTNSQFRMSAEEAEQPPVVIATGDIDLANVTSSPRCSTSGRQQRRHHGRPVGCDLL